MVYRVSLKALKPRESTKEEREANQARLKEMIDRIAALPKDHPAHRTIC